MPHPEELLWLLGCLNQELVAVCATTRLAAVRVLAGIDWERSTGLWHVDYSKLKSVLRLT